MKFSQITFFSLVAMFSSGPSLSCDMHGAGPHPMGFMERTRALSVVELRHKAFTSANLNEETRLQLSYVKPIEATDVRIELVGTENILLGNKEFVLASAAGSLETHFVLAKKGYDSISVRVTGEYNGRDIYQVSTIYVRARKAAKNK